MTAPIAHPTALAPIGFCRGPRFSTTLPPTLIVAAVKIAKRPAGEIWPLKLGEKSTTTPAKAVIAPASLGTVSRSMPSARVKIALVIGNVAYITAASPDGTVFSPQ